MTISDRIIELRKQNSLSQEDLAEVVGVSRQAVSKWESGQSTPDIEKVIKLSEYFNISTDYLLKGEQLNNAQKNQEKSKVNMMIFVVVSTALNFLGLIMASFVWYEEQVPMATGVGLIFFTLGLLIYFIGHSLASTQDRQVSSKKFWMINIWIVSFIPMSVIFNALQSRMLAPYPLIYNSLIYIALFFVVYLVFCTAITLHFKNLNK